MLVIIRGLRVEQLVYIETGPKYVYIAQSLLIGSPESFLLILQEFYKDTNMF